MSRGTARRLFYAVMFLAALLRLWGLRWDLGHHLHPDERFTSMVEERISYPKNPLRYLDSQTSTLNPYNNGFGSFVYGTLPLFATKLIADLTGLKGYDGAYLVGRVLSGVFDLLTVWLTYLITRRLAGRGTSLTATAFMAFCPLGIQLSHFWGVDSFLTTFSAAALLGALRIAQGRSRLSQDLATGVAMGLAGACKITGLALLAPVGVAILVRRFQDGLPRESSEWIRRLARVAGESLLVAAAALVTIRLTLPYAFLGLWKLDPRFLADIRNLKNITSSVAGFPPMLQWAGRTVLFPLKNFVFWGAAPFFGVTALAAVVWAPFRAVRRRALLLVPVWVYAVAVFGYHATTNTMTIRYFYPAYPALAALAAVFLAALVERSILAGAGRWRARLLPAAVVAGAFLCGFAFHAVYRHTNTRHQASRWIYAHVPPPARFANEDWDDGLPFSDPEHDVGAYSGPAMHMYDPESRKKVEDIVGNLEKADWIAITSNRAYASITRVPDVYPMTTAYYRALFDGRLGFEWKANFASYPRIGPLVIPDDTAEETYTVYDHPRVLLFAKGKDFSAARVRRMLTAALAPVPRTMDEWQKLPRRQRRVAPALVPPIRPGVEESPAPSSREFPLGSIAAAVAFYVAVLAVGAAAFPLTFALFPRLADRGAGFARVVGLAAMTYLFSVAVHWRIFPNGRGTAVVCLALLLLVSAAIFFVRRREMRAFVRERSRLLWQGEIVFAAGFLIFTFIRALNPEIYWGEKPMDFSILNILVRTPTLPASDPWFSGAPLGYYTFGQQMIAVLTLLTGLSTAFTFNLAFGWIGGASLQGAFTLARNWTGRGKAGAAAAALVGIVGNLAGLREWLIGQPGRGEARHLDWHYFWATSRVIRDTINEYPFWSLVFADLHAHVLALPMLLLVLACALSCVRTHSEPGASLPARVGSGLLLGFSAGAAVLTNAWDAPLLAGLLLLTFLVCAFQPGRFSLTETLGTLPAFLAAGAIAIALVLPLWARGGGPPALGRNTEAGARGVDILTVFGLFLFLAFAWWMKAAYRKMLETGWERPVAWGTLGLAALALLALAVLLPSAFLAAGVLFFVLAAIIFAGSREDRLAIGLVAAALFLVFFTQRWYIYDRMNTFFKLYLEAWLLFAIGGAVLAFRQVGTPGSFAEWGRPLRVALALLFAAAFFTSATAGFGAVSRGRPTFADTGFEHGLTLDGLAYRERAHPGEYRAVLWMRRNIRGTPVVLEAQGPSYQEFSRISMLTGLPTVLGWEYHVQQRGNAPKEIDERREDVKFIYSSPSSDPIEGLLRKYHVGYVYVGWLEKKTYPPPGLKKFDTDTELFRVVYENPESKIYRVVGGDAQDVILPAKETLPPPKEKPAGPPADEPEEAPAFRDAAEPGHPPFWGMREPRDAALDEKGRLWVADFGNSRIRLFNSDGGFLGGWGGRGSGVYGLRELCGVASRGDRLYIADTWNGRVLAFSLGGEPKGSAAGLYGPRGVAVAPDGSVWVTDSGNNRLMVYDAGLEKGREIGKKGSGPGEFSGPVGIAVGDNGLVYVTDTTNKRIEVLNESGRFVRAIALPDLAPGSEPYVDVEASGVVYATIPSADAVVRFAPSGDLEGRWTTDAGGVKFARPTGLAVDSRNHMLYVVNSANNTVSKLPVAERTKR